MALQEKSVHLCFSFIVSQIFCTSMYTTHHHRDDKFKEICSAFWWWKTGSPALRCSCQRSTLEVLGEQHWLTPHSCARSCSVSSFALFSRPWFRAVDTKFNYHDSASWSAMIHTQLRETCPAPCPACLVVSSPTKQALQHLREEDIRLARLSLGCMHWLLFSSQQRIPLEGNARACLWFSFTVHSPNKAFPPFTSPFTLAQAVRLLFWPEYTNVSIF